jgi:hypothetical protein
MPCLQHASIGMTAACILVRRFDGVKAYALGYLEELNSPKCFADQSVWMAAGSEHSRYRLAAIVTGTPSIL